jgi:putative 4-mercaptohistidine N1-methyltranferase
MVTNGEFWAFVADGGYRNRENWCDDGWAWRTHRNLKWPFFWTPAGPQGSHEYSLRTIFEEIPMMWDWPVDVTYYESKAFCKWKTEKDGSPTSRPLRILTEAEHQIIRHREHNLDAARSVASSDKVMATSGADFRKGPTGANLNMAFASQNPVDCFPPSHTGHHDVIGNSWEWTEDHFNPLRNFEVHHVYDDFSTPCFDGKHSMIVGGSFMSTGDEASVFTRFHFRPHFLQHSGFRLVASEEDAPATHLFPGSFSGQAAARDEAAVDEEADPKRENVYETDDLLGMYLGLHFPLSGSAEGVSPVLAHANAPVHGLRFPQRVAELLCSLNPVRTSNRVLDVGCAVGGASFELAKSFDQVEAFDFSENFVTAAKRIQSGEELTFKIPIEGDITEEVRVEREPGVDASVLEKVNFFQGDATKISEYAESREGFGPFDGVVLANLLCRLPDPMACLSAMPRIVNEGGVVVIVTPFTWLEDFTSRSKWLGGFKDPVSQAPIYSKDKLKQVMEGLGFEKIHEEQMPLVIREHQRKYQYIISEASGWRKK